MSQFERNAQQQNFFQYPLTEYFSFPHDFVFESYLSPREVAVKLQKLGYRKQGDRRTRRVLVEITPHEGLEFSFEMRTAQPRSEGGRRSRKVLMESARATGRIFTNNDGVTIIEGTIIAGSYGYCFSTVQLILGIIFWIIVLINLCNLLTKLTPIVLYGVVFAIFVTLFSVFFLDLYRDPNYLLEIIEDTVFPEENKISL